MHSTYLLRMFNDCVAILFMNLCILFSLQNKWGLSVLLYSFALSIKMNILLYLPGLLLVLNWTFNYLTTLGTLVFVVGFQVLIALPFLQTNPGGYFKMAFDFSRVFDQKESAYWQFVPEETFRSKAFHNGLLVLHVLSLLVFLYRKAVCGSSIRSKLRSLNLPSSLKDLTSPGQGVYQKPEHIAYVLFFTHFIGIFFSRSFHIQYYTWYIYTLPFLLCYGQRSLWKIGLFGLLEVAYVQYPPKLYSSVMVFVLHLGFLCLFDRMFGKVTPEVFRVKEKEKEEKEKEKDKKKKGR